MNLLKRILAGMLVVCMALSLAGCGDTTWIAKVDGVTIPSGLYIYYQTEGYGNALFKLYQEDQDYLYQYLYYYNYGYVMPELFEVELSDGMTVEESMNDYAISKCKQAVVVDRLFEELNLSLTEDEEAIIDNNVKTVWNNNGSNYEKAGIGQESLRLAILETYKEDKVFDAYYEIGGLNGTTEEEIETYFSDNYARVKYMTFTFAESIDDAVDETRKNEQLELANSYVERANAGESMDDLIEEYNAYLEEQSAEDETDGSEADDAENGAEPDETEDTADDAADSEDTDADSDESDDVNVEAEENEYANETILNKEGKFPTEKFVSYVFSSCPVGETSVIQDDLCFYVVQRLDILEREGLYEDYRDSILTELFDSDYTKLMNDKLSGYSVEENKNSIKRYKAKNAFPDIED